MLNNSNSKQNNSKTDQDNNNNKLLCLIIKNIIINNVIIKNNCDNLVYSTEADINRNISNNTMNKKISALSVSYLCSNSKILKKTIKEFPKKYS